MTDDELRVKLQKIIDQNNRQEEKQDEHKAALDRLNQHITGGDEPEKGLLIKVDRLTEKDKTREKQGKIFMGAIASALVTAVVSLFKA